VYQDIQENIGAPHRADCIRKITCASEAPKAWKSNFRGFEDLRGSTIEFADGWSTGYPCEGPIQQGHSGVLKNRCGAT
jgi:hypothetical protein